MFKTLSRLAAGLLLAASVGLALAANPQVEIQTSEGRIVVELYQDKAPKTVDNFLQYTKDGFYNGTIFHRVIDGFMIQGGGFTPDLVQKATRAPVENEAKNGLKNDIGTIAMARTNNPHSATAQFFINLVDNRNLDYPSFDGWGYTVFGKVREGIDVVKKIGQVRTGNQGVHQNVPVTPVVIQSVTTLNGDTPRRPSPAPNPKPPIEKKAENGELINTVDGFEFRVFKEPTYNDNLYYYEAVGGPCRGVGIEGLVGRLDDIRQVLRPNYKNQYSLTGLFWVDSLKGRISINHTVNYSASTAENRRRYQHNLSNRAPQKDIDNANSSYKMSECLEMNHMQYVIAFENWVKRNEKPLMRMYNSAWNGK